LGKNSSKGTTPTKKIREEMEAKEATMMYHKIFPTIIKIKVERIEKLVREKRGNISYNVIDAKLMELYTRHKVFS